jgi:serine/threonine protein kinase
MSVQVSEDAERADHASLIGQVLANRYQIEHLLGEGAMGAVYKARHIKVGRPFAVKILHKRLLEDAKLALRFEREAELAGRLRHPNVIGVVDVGETPDGWRYMVMDFAEGVDLATLLGEAPMPPQRITNLVRQMLEGLYHAHEAGLIHRDFKPENVIVERDDHDVEVPRIVDFGIAILREGGESTDAAGRLTTNGLVLGTPHYMAPEQAVADPIDHRIDLFAMGIVIYEMLSGRLPFDGSGAEVARANLLLDPPPIAQRVPYLEVDPLLEAFARKLLAKKRDHRPANAKVARELLDLIERDRAAAATALGVSVAAASRLPAVTADATPVKKVVIEELEVAADPPIEAPPMQRRAAVSTASVEPASWDESPPRRRWPWLVVGGATVVAASAAIVIALGGGEPAPRIEPPAPAPAPIAEQPQPQPPPPPASAPVQEPAPTPAPAVAVAEPPPPTPGKLKRPRPTARAVETKPAPAPAPAPPPPARVETTPAPETKPASPEDENKALVAQFSQVRLELNAAKQKLGPDAVNDIDTQVRNMHVNELLAASPSERPAIKAKLARFHEQLAERMKR